MTVTRLDSSLWSLPVHDFKITPHEKNMRTISGHKKICLSLERELIYVVNGDSGMIQNKPGNLGWMVLPIIFEVKR